MVNDEENLRAQAMFGVTVFGTRKLGFLFKDTL